MMKRAVLFFMVSFMVTVGLTGCGNNPDKLFKDGKYAEAYTEFVKRAGTNEIKLKTETVNASAYETQQRQKSGNQALHDFYYAAECQKQLGNTAEANMYYQRVVDISRYQIRTPHDQGALLKASFASLLSAVQSYRSAQVDYIDEATRPPEDEETDPYDSGNGNTDPYDGGSGNTDPYDGGSGNTDPYSGGNGNTDPYNSVAKSATVAKSASVSDTWMRSAYNTMVSRRQEFERLLYSTTADQVSNIQSIKDQYRTFSSALDTYLSFASPSKTVSSPEWVESFGSMYYRSVSSAGNQFTSTLSGAQSKITYTVEPFNVTEPQLVVQATAALGGSASSSEAQAVVEPEQRIALQVEGSVAPVTGDIKTAEASMKAAFDTYKNLCSTGADEAEVKKALSAYNEAKATFNALKNQK
ncbi:MAG: hypothetical protein BWY66_01661 [bacterium ADurb.Bin374]|nr:MAG: hypothetical protein BWY66_01661 [bacterium ADurb.Bin374]